MSKLEFGSLAVFSGVFSYDTTLTLWGTIAMTVVLLIGFYFILGMFDETRN